MLKESSSPRHLVLLAQVTVLGIAILAAQGMPASATSETTIRPFKVRVPDAALADLRKRIAVTRWPDKETVADASQGVPLAKLQELVRYWGSGYSWRRVEAKLNGLPQFMTDIEGVDIHFIHVRSRHSNALPLIITHGWPGSIIEQLKIIGPLTDPEVHGGSAEEAFDVVIRPCPATASRANQAAPVGTPSASRAPGAC